MKKFLITALSLVCFTSVFMSCSDDDDNKGNNGNGYDGYPYSELTQQQQKEKLNEDGLKFIAEMQDLSDEKGVGLLTTFYMLTDMSNPGGSSEPDANDAIVDSQRAIAVDNIININEFYGKYTWDAEIQEWEISESADKLVFEFPASLDAETNNGKIEITGVASDVNYDGYQLPKELNAKLFVDNLDAGSITVKSNIVSGTSIPSTAEATFVFGKYKLAMNADKGNTNKATVKLTKDSKTLLDGNVNLVANLDEWVNKGDDYVPSSANGGIKILSILEMSVKSANIAKIAEEVYVIEKKYNAMEEWTSDLEKAETDEIVAVYNKYMDAGLVSLDDKTAIATLVASTREETYGSYKYYYQDYALKFHDDSEAYLDVYFGTGFSKVINAINDFIESFVPAYN